MVNTTVLTKTRKTSHLRLPWTSVASSAGLAISVSGSAKGLRGRHVEENEENEENEARRFEHFKNHHDF